MYKIELTRSARKAYLKLPSKIRLSINQKLNNLAESPYAKHNDVKHLSGTKDCYRLRAGDWRVIYRLHNNALIIEVIKIAHRKEVYQ
jgi:mRNA interferase RelE/StbE